MRSRSNTVLGILMAGFAAAAGLPAILSAVALAKAEAPVATAGLPTIAPGATAGAQEAFERPLWSLWKLHQSNEHDAVVSACRQLETTASTNVFLPVARGIAAWHLLKTGKNAEASALFSNLLATVDVNASALADKIPPLTRASDTLARRWLTRLDIQVVQKALKVHYKKNIEYPPSLEVFNPWPKETRPPKTDRWDKPWDYRLTGFRELKGLANQKYALDSQVLKTESDLAAALARPYGDMPMKPVRSLSEDSIEFETTDAKPRKISLSLGTSEGVFVLAHTGVKILILCNGDHWIIVPRP